MSRVRTPIGARIKRRRIAAGLSQAALAQALGISASYLNLIENNKRAIGGTLLLRIGERLGIDLEHLSGESEIRTIGTIGELMADPVMRGIEMEHEAIRDLVARFPEAGAALARLYRAFADATAEIDVLQHRLKSDPLLSQLLHPILNRIAGIKSGAEILEGIADLTEEERRRFVGTINAEARELVPSMQSLVDYFDQAAARQKRVSPISELDEAIVANGNHFPALEDAAATLRAELAGKGQPGEAAVARALEKQLGVACRIRTARNGRHEDGASGDDTLWLDEIAPPSSRCQSAAARAFSSHSLTRSAFASIHSVAWRSTSDWLPSPSFICAFWEKMSSIGSEAVSSSERIAGFSLRNVEFTTGRMSLAGKPSLHGLLTQPATPSSVAASARLISSSGRSTSGTSIHTTSSPGFSVSTVQFGVQV